MSKRNAFSSGNIWTIGIGLGLFLWGLLSLLDHFLWNIIPGTYWLLIPGGIMLIAGISNVINYRYNRERILAALKSYNTVSISQLANELKMQEKDVKEIIVDLRTEGRLKASFDTESGDVMVLEVLGQPPLTVTPVSSSGLPEHEAVISSSKFQSADQGYCQYCGSMVKPDDRFCNNCGSAIS
jgi:hypothetical protein